jgi:hypothetical protein
MKTFHSLLKAPFTIIFWNNLCHIFGVFCIFSKIMYSLGAPLEVYSMENTVLILTAYLYTASTLEKDAETKDKLS